MLEISDQVVDSFAGQAHAGFEDRALRFLCDRFPDALAMSGEDGMRQAIRRGQQNALLSGFESELTMIHFMVLQHLFGSNVDVGPAYPEIRAALHDKRLDPEARMEQAMRVAAERLEREYAASGA